MAETTEELANKNKSLITYAKGSADTSIMRDLPGPGGETCLISGYRDSQPKLSPYLQDSVAPSVSSHPDFQKRGSIELIGSQTHQRCSLFLSSSNKK